MRYYTPLLLTASLTLGALIPVMAQPPAAKTNELYRGIQTSIRAKQYPEAVTQAEQALTIIGLSTTDKIRFLNIAADATIAQGASYYPAAKMYYEKIIADPAMNNLPMSVSVTNPNRMNGTDGGINTPKVPPAATVAVA